MTAPLLLTATKNGTVHYGGQTYRQVPINRLPPPPVVGNTCYWCAAYSDMRLCDAMCGFCKLEHVFVKREARNVRRD